MDINEDGTDATSIKPVSSLRSRFENLGKDGGQKPAPQLERRQVSLTVDDPQPVRRPRTSDGESSDAAENSVVFGEQPLAGFRRNRPDPPKPRPQSMISVTPSQKSPPMVTVNSPRSPPSSLSIDMRLASSKQSSSPLSTTGSPTRAHARTISRTASPALEARMSVFMQSPTPPPQIDFASKPKLPEPKGDGPPPVNRAGKPSVPKKPAVLAQKPNGLAAPEPSADVIDHTVSPFGTPPASGPASPEIEQNALPDRARNNSDASFVERLRSDSDALTRVRTGSDASWVQRIRGDSDASLADLARIGSNGSSVEASSLPRESFHHPSNQSSSMPGREHHFNGLSRAPTMPARYRSIKARDQNVAGDLSESKPRLPARPELQFRPGRTSPTRPRGGRTSPSKLSQQFPPAKKSVEGLRRAATVADHSPQQRIPASKPIQRSALTQGFDRTIPALAAPAPPAPRRSLDKRREMPLSEAHGEGHSRDDQEDVMPVEASTGTPNGSSDYPDSTNANRRPPRFRQRPHQIPTEYDTRLFAVCGETICTSGYITKAWNIRTGEQLLNMVHSENIKVTSMIFKPAPEVEEEGKRVWLGTNVGELHEVDIPSQSLVKTKTMAHAPREVSKMFRHGAELWTLDSGGELHVWKPDHKGYPSLDSTHNSFRVQPRGHTFSIACGEHLWVAFNKELRVFRPGARSDTDFPVLRNALSQPGTGDITSGATLSSKPDLVYFGHSDGKVSVYNTKDYSCAAVVNVSLYKISSMVGVGEYLWAGYNTGMAYVYDTSTTPWRVKKDWQVHEKQVSSIVADPSALWKMNRLQVISLGTDNMLRIWDGLLEDDWLEWRMQEYDSNYCAFREITVGVMTWNAGATKPQYLQQSPEDSLFLRDFMVGREPPDILVFGFQELVDLEDKKVTAKSFFKSKKKDGGEQEHMSHQYRAWRDHLTRCVEDYMPTDQPYTLLHTASMVGLFTCVFVKSSERPHIRHVHAAEVKRGMGGLHGNKGALILRVILDDSSICFVNCHLAAGQTQTIHRNNDIAAILEADALPAYPISNTNSKHGDVFSSGGDGSMVLDHEICILNGDLNYRIDTMGRDTVVKHVAQNNLARLLDRDQLLLSKKKNPGFRLRAFQESPITFAPTYKYNLHSDEYDTSEKRRAPAWCDRILYRGLGKVKMEEYRRWEVRVSDHRPVSGRLRVRVKEVDAQRREQVWAVCAKEFDEVRARIAKGVQREYLVNTLALSSKEATAAVYR